MEPNLLQTYGWLQEKRGAPDEALQLGRVDPTVVPAEPQAAPLVLAAELAPLRARAQALRPAPGPRQAAGVLDGCLSRTQIGREGFPL